MSCYQSLTFLQYRFIFINFSLVLFPSSTLQFHLFIPFFMAVLHLQCCMGAFSSCCERASPCGAQAAVLAEGWLSSSGARVQLRMACGVFMEQGSDSGPLHWRADSQPLNHQGNLTVSFLVHVNTLIYLECTLPKSCLYIFFTQFSSGQSNLTCEVEKSIVYENYFNGIISCSGTSTV